MRRAGVVALASVAVLCAVDAACGGEGPAWPCFHGQRRDNRSAETGLLKTWPTEGLTLLWTAPGIGHGYSSVAVSGGRIFAAGMTNKQTNVIALDLNGKELWRRPNGESWQASERQSWAVPYAGARGTPTVDGDTVYHLSDLGRLTAFDVKSGEGRWHVDIMAVFKPPRPKYGYSESVLILGDRLLCCPGGKEGYVVALDKRTGRTLWANSDISDPIGYSSLVAAEIGGVEQVIGSSAARLFAVRMDNGRMLWQHAFGNKQNNSATDVIVHDGLVYASSGYGKGSILLRPTRQDDGRFSVKPVWESDLLDNHHGGVILVDGYLYGAGHEARGWFCLAFGSGEKRWQAPGKGSLTYADGRLYCLDEKGTMFLVQPTPEKWLTAGSLAVPKGGQGAYWAHPVVCGGRLYVRHSENLYAYRLHKD